MGNYRFRLSDMMPNAWFYKLKEMGSNSNNKARNHSNNNNNISKKKQQRPISPSTTTTTTKQQQQQQYPSYYPRKSYYFTRELNIPTAASSSPPTNTTKSTTADSLRRLSNSKQRQPRGRRIRKSSAVVRSPSPKVVTSSVSAGCSCRATLWAKAADSPPDYSPSNDPSSSSPSSPSTDSSASLRQQLRSDSVLSTESFDDMLTWSRAAACTNCKLNSNAGNDIVIDVGNKVDDELELELPPIITKAPKFNDMVKGIKKKEQQQQQTNGRRNASSLSVEVVKEERITVKAHNTTRRQLSVNSPGGVRLRIHSPRIATRRLIQGHQARKSLTSSSSSSATNNSSGSSRRRRSLSESFAVVKSSLDPQRDFRESMVEMIMENNIRASKDLEDLLACYLSLNSDEYHDLIINVFKQIWFDFSQSNSRQ